MDAALHDLTQGIRTLARNRGFTAMAVLTLALGIGANTAIFTVVHAALLRPLPYFDADRIVLAFANNAQQGVERTGVSAIDYNDWREQSGAFSATALYGPHGFTLTGVDEPEEVLALAVSHGFFEVLGIDPEHGRSFTEEETVLGNHQVVVLSQGLWQRRFGADPDVIGTTITLSDQPYTIVGVMPAGFRFPNENIGFWAPFPFPIDRVSRAERWLGVIGRLDDGVTLDAARAELASIAGGLAADHPETNAGWGAEITPLHEVIVADLRPALLAFQAAIGLVLLIACANVANLLLVRLSARREEIALRAALGAGPGRLARQLLVESGLVAIAGGALGLGLAVWGVNALLSALPTAGPEDSHAFVALAADRVEAGGAVFGYALAISALAGLLAGVLPALRLRGDRLTTYIKEGAGHTGSSRRLRDAVVAAEVAVALVLLVGAGLLTRSFTNLVSVDPGFNADSLLTFRLGLSSQQYYDPARRLGFWNDVLAELEAIPAVTGIAASTSLPFGGVEWNAHIEAVDHPEPPATGWPNVRFHTITPDYFRALGIPVVRGRALTQRDGAEAPKVAIVNQTLAQRLWPDSDPLGKRVRLNYAETEYELVGIVGDTGQTGLDTPIGPEVFVSNAQNPSFFLDFAVRTGGEPLDAAATIRDRVWAIDANLPIANVGTMRSLLSRSTATARLSVLLAAALGAVALALAGVGIFAVISYGVSRRTREIGVRRALGAEGADLYRTLLGQSMRTALLGIVIGIAAAVGAARLLSGFLFGVTQYDPFALLGASVLIAGVALVACLVPIGRAVRVDPVDALRAE